MPEPSFYYRNFIILSNFSTYNIGLETGVYSVHTRHDGDGGMICISSETLTLVTNPSEISTFSFPAHSPISSQCLLKAVFKTLDPGDFLF